MCVFLFLFLPGILVSRWLVGFGKASLFGARCNSNVSSVKNQNHIKLWNNSKVILLEDIWWKKRKRNTWKLLAFLRHTLYTKCIEVSIIKVLILCYKYPLKAKWDQPDHEHGETIHTGQKFHNNHLICFHKVLTIFSPRRTTLME